MSELFEKSIRVLELPRLLEMLEHHAVSAEAKARARRLTPSDDFGEVNRLLADNQKITQLTGWATKVAFREGLEHTARWIGRNLHYFDMQRYAV